MVQRRPADYSLVQVCVSNLKKCESSASWDVNRNRKQALCHTDVRILVQACNCCYYIVIEAMCFSYVRGTAPRTVQHDADAGHTVCIESWTGHCKGLRLRKVQGSASQLGSR